MVQKMLYSAGLTGTVILVLMSVFQSVWIVEQTRAHPDTVTIWSYLARYGLAYLAVLFVALTCPTSRKLMLLVGAVPFVLLHILIVWRFADALELWPPFLFLDALLFSVCFVIASIALRIRRYVGGDLS